MLDVATYIAQGSRFAHCVDMEDKYPRPRTINGTHRLSWGEVQARECHCAICKSERGDEQTATWHRPTRNGVNPEPGSEAERVRRLWDSTKEEPCRAPNEG